MVTLVLKSLFHGSQRDLSIVLRDVIMEAANRGTHEGQWGTGRDLGKALSAHPAQEIPILASLTEMRGDNILSKTAQ